MRLLDTHTGQFVEKDPDDEKTVYAILRERLRARKTGSSSEAVVSRPRLSVETSRLAVDLGRSVVERANPRRPVGDGSLSLLWELFIQPSKRDPLVRGSALSEVIGREAVEGR